MNEIADKYRATAKFLLAEADAIDPPASTPNLWANPTPTAWPLPAGLVTKENPFGADPRFGSPGWQVTLRTYARRDNIADRNRYIKDRQLECLWPDQDQDWEVGNI